MHHEPKLRSKVNLRRVRQAPPLRPGCADADLTPRSSGRSKSPNTVLPPNILHKPDNSNGGNRRKRRLPSLAQPIYPFAVIREFLPRRDLTFRVDRPREVWNYNS